MDLTFSACCLSDAEKIFRIVNRLNYDYQEIKVNKDYVLYSDLEEVRDDIIDGNYVIVEYDNFPIGCVKYKIYEMNGLLGCYLGPLVVIPEYQYAGVESEILNYIIDQAKINRCDNITIDIINTMPDLISVYKQLGFCEVAIEPYLHYDNVFVIKLCKKI